MIDSKEFEATKQNPLHMSQIWHDIFPKEHTFNHPILYNIRMR